MATYTRGNTLLSLSSPLGAIDAWAGAVLTTLGGVDTLTVTNIDLSMTRITGTGFVLGALTVPSAGAITKIEHLDSLGLTVLETFTGIPAAFTLPFYYAHIANVNFETTLFAGDDSITGGLQDDQLSGLGGSDTIHGGGGDDIIDGGAGADHIFGDAGNDTLISNDGEGADSIDGGGDIDTATVNRSSFAAAQTADFSIAANTVTLLDGTTLVNVESVLFASGAGSDTLTSSNDTRGADFNSLDGGAGSDTLNASAHGALLEGGAGNDTLNGSAVSDLLYGGGDDDTIHGGGGADTIDGGAGADHIFGDAGNDLISSTDGADIIDGGGNIDTLFMDRSSFAGQITANFALASVVLSDGSQISNVEIVSFKSGTGNDILTASNDTSGSDSNRLYGGGGNDTLTASSHGAFLSGDAGDDTLNGSAAFDRLDGGADNDTILTGGGDDIVTGGAGDDTITANGNGNTFIHGDDLLGAGPFGNDTIDLSAVAAGFSNQVYGDGGNDTIIGSAGADDLTGGTGNDGIDGGGGLDIAHFSGPRDGYAIERVDGAATAWLVADTFFFNGNDGLDTLTNIETLRFGLGVPQDLALSDLIGVVLDSDAAGNTVTENDANGSTAGLTVHATDGSGDAVIYSLADTAGGRFAIDAASGVVTVANGALLNFATAASHTIAVKATSADGSLTQKSFTIGVTSLSPLAPGDTDAATNTVLEGATNGATVGITAHSTAPGPVTYALTDTAGGRFQIDAATGVVTVANGALLDFEVQSSHAIRVEASNAGGAIASQSFAISVGNAPPSIATDADSAVNSIAEGAQAGTAAGITAASSDPGIGAVSYSLSNSAGGRFQIDASSGVVTVANGAALDFEAAASHAIVIRAADSSGAFSTQTFNIAVTNINEAPTGIVLNSAGIAEFARGGTIAGSLSALDPDAGGSFTYTMLDNAGGRFAVSGNQIVVANGLLLDFEQAAAHSVKVRVTDQGGLSFDKTLNVSVNNIDPEVVTGDAANNVFTGGRLKDTLNGGAGDDTLTGGLAKDLLTGGAGRDVFDFNGVKDSGKTAATRDVILDFKHGQDRIDIKDIDASLLKAGDQAFKFIATQGFHHIAAELHFLKFDHPGANNDFTLIEGDVNGDGRADFQIELKGLIALSKGDFIL